MSGMRSPKLPELSFVTLRNQFGFDAISLMPTNLYGPDNYHPTNSHVLPALIRRFYEAKKQNDVSVTCWGTGTPLREFLHVDDLEPHACLLLSTGNPDLRISHF